MSKKIIKLTESELYEIVNNIIKEQKPDHLMPGQPDNPSNVDGIVTKYRSDLKKSMTIYKCVPNQFAYPMMLLLDKGYNKMWLKCGLGIIGRESSFASGGRYAVTNSLKKIANIVGYDSSLGPAQMKGSTAEDLGIDPDDLFTDIGALDAAYRLIKRNFNLARSKGYTQEPSNLGSEGTGNATLDIAIASYNGGASYMGPWCESTDPKRKEKGYKDKCNKIPKDKQIIVKNYVPNYKTERWDGVNINTHGYVIEVAGWIRKMTCIR